MIIRILWIHPTRGMTSGKCRNIYDIWELVIRRPRSLSRMFADLNRRKCFQARLADGCHPIVGETDYQDWRP
jgi:hypothetical protein